MWRVAHYAWGFPVIPAKFIYPRNPRNSFWKARKMERPGRIGIYTNDAAENPHHSLRKVIKAHGSFPSDEAAITLLCRYAPASMGGPIEWTAAMGQLAILIFLCRNNLLEQYVSFLLASAKFSDASWERVEDDATLVVPTLIDDLHAIEKTYIDIEGPWCSLSPIRSSPSNTMIWSGPL